MSCRWARSFIHGSNLTKRTKCFPPRKAFKKARSRAFGFAFRVLVVSRLTSSIPTSAACARDSSPRKSPKATTRAILNSAFVSLFSALIRVRKSSSARLTATALNRGDVPPETASPSTVVIHSSLCSPCLTYPCIWSTASAAPATPRLIPTPRAKSCVVQVKVPFVSLRKFKAAAAATSGMGARSARDFALNGFVGLAFFDFLGRIGRDPRWCRNRPCSGTSIIKRVELNCDGCSEEGNYAGLVGKKKTLHPVRLEAPQIVDVCSLRSQLGQALFAQHAKSCESQT